MPKSAALKRANAKYERNNYDKVLLRIRHDGDGPTRDAITAAATAAGESLNAYILNAVSMRMNAGDLEKKTDAEQSPKK